MNQPKDEPTNEGAHYCFVKGRLMEDITKAFGSHSPTSFELETDALNKQTDK